MDFNRLNRAKVALKFFSIIREEEDGEGLNRAKVALKFHLFYLL